MNTEIIGNNKQVREWDTRTPLLHTVSQFSFCSIRFLYHIETAGKTCYMGHGITCEVPGVTENVGPLAL
jgi:hypothetical protein